MPQCCETESWRSVEDPNASRPLGDEHISHVWGGEKKKQTIFIFILILIYSGEIGTAAIERETPNPKPNPKTCPADNSQASGYILLLEIYDWRRRRSHRRKRWKGENAGNGGKCPRV